MKRLVLISLGVAVVTIAASPRLRHRIAAAGREFGARYREHERAITAAVLNRSAAN